MNSGEAIVLTIIALVIAAVAIRSIQKWKRDRWIENYAFPDSIPVKVLEQYPHLNSEQVESVMEGMREYFHVCHAAGKRMVAMPSRAVDAAWHEFILFTRGYQQFCQKAFGRYLHHTPAEAMEKPMLAQDGIKRAWRISCTREAIDRKDPERLPLLFTMDGDLEIADRFKYALNCQRSEAAGYCAAHIGCASGCSSDCGGDSGCGGGGCGGD